MTDQYFMEQAIMVAKEGMKHNGGPFGAVVVKANKIIGMGSNLVTNNNDPTAHAEVVAIRNACQALSRFHLEDCTLYSTCEPCPMCLAAIYWARIPRIYFASNRYDAKHAGFDDAWIYEECCLPVENRQVVTQQIEHDMGNQLFEQWILKKDKISY